MNLKYLSRLLIAFFSRFKLVLIISIVLGILAFSFLRFILPIFVSTKVENIGIVGRYTPDSLPTSILKMISTGLTNLNAQGIPEPSLASSWETKDEGKTWTFDLRGDRFWQDGKKVEAGELIFKFSDAKVSTPNKKTIVFTLQNAFSPFPAVVSQPLFKKGLLGTGEWKVTKLTLVGNFVDQLVLVNKNREKKVLKFFPSEERAKLAFKLGSIDVISEVFTKEPFELWKTANLHPHQSVNRIVAIFFNTKEQNLSEKSLRQALAYAINKEDFEGERAISPIAETSWAYNPQVKPYDYDQKRANVLIDELPEKVRNKLSITLTTSPILLSEAEKVVKNWNDLGIKANVQGFSGIPTEFQAFMAIFDIPEDPDQYSFWHTSQTATNISKFSNPKIDKLLEDGRTELNFENRRKIYLDFQRFLAEDSPAIFLYHPITYRVERK